MLSAIHVQGVHEIHPESTVPVGGLMRRAVDDRAPGIAHKVSAGIQTFPEHGPSPPHAGFGGRETLAESHRNLFLRQLLDICQENHLAVAIGQAVNDSPKRGHEGHKVSISPRYLLLRKGLVQGGLGLPRAGMVGHCIAGRAVKPGSEIMSGRFDLELLLQLKNNLLLQIFCIGFVARPRMGNPPS